MKNIMVKGVIMLLFIGLNGFSNDLEEYETPLTIEAEITDAAVLGSVIAPGAIICIYATNGSEEITGYTNNVGEFFINGFPEGTFDITISAYYNKSISVQHFEEVSFNIGEVTALGTVNFDE